MKILFLDDDLNRHDEMRRRVRELREAGLGHRGDVELVAGVRADMLRGRNVYDFDALFLDFDLNGKTMLPWGHPDSATEAILWIAAQPHGNARIVLHSLNNTIYDRVKIAMPHVKVVPAAFTRTLFHEVMGTRLFGTEPMFPDTADRPEEKSNAR